MPISTLIMIRTRRPGWKTWCMRRPRGWAISRISSREPWRVIDDHIPFMKAACPAADLIDFDYGYNNVFWHTPQDTVDKLSPKSLEIVGAHHAGDGPHSGQDGPAAAEVNAYAASALCAIMLLLFAFALFRNFVSNHPTCETESPLGLLLLLAPSCFAAAPPAETDDAARIIQAALKPSPLESNLHHLTDEIGGRVPGTPAMQHAVEWGVQAFNAAGADSVHTEEFTIPNSWAEGATEMTVTALLRGRRCQGRRIPADGVPCACSFDGMGAGARSHEAVPVVDVGDGVPLISRRPATFPASWCWCIRLCSRPGTISSPNIRTRRR